MSAHRELAEKLALLEELQRRLENGQDGFARFYTESTTEDEDESGDSSVAEYEAEGFDSLERLTDFFAGFTATEVMELPVPLHTQFTASLNGALSLLEDARKFDPVADLARYRFTDKASFIQAADEIFEDIPEDLHAFKREFEEQRPV